METLTENILNVTLLEPRMKHPTIFIRFDGLMDQESLTIHNDHDPKPLYYQLLGERGNIFQWEYLEQGPVWWKVRITKKLNNQQEDTLGQLAAKDLRKADIFKKYGLDFCCGGKKTVKEACAEKGLDVTRIEQELQQTEKAPAARPIPYNEWSLDFLADYIVNIHHGFVRKALPDLVTYSAKIASVHGDNHPELIVIAKLVEEINNEMLSHMVKEERVLFPYVKDLVNAKKNNEKLPLSPFGTVKNPINIMEMEHEFVGNHMAEIRQLTNDYALPADACASYSYTFKLLQEFEEDLHMHIHLENNILFPKGLELEKSLQ